MSFVCFVIVSLVYCYIVIFELTLLSGQGGHLVWLRDLDDILSGVVSSLSVRGQLLCTRYTKQVNGAQPDNKEV